VVWMIDFGAHADKMRTDLYPEQFSTGERKKILLEVQPVLPPDNPIEADRVKQELTQTNLDVEEKYSASLYFVPALAPTDRMINQQGWFSVCSSLTAFHDEAIAKAFWKFMDRNWARKLIIAKEAKSDMLRALRAMNITAETIYPGLDGLGKSLADIPALFEPKSGITYDMHDGVLTQSDNSKTA